MRMDVHQSEDTDGIRFSWNVWPGSRLEATRAVVPVGCMYSPLKKISNLPLLGYDPVSCKSCSSVLNPYCTVDVRTKLWVCPFCFQRNQLPPAYENINEQTLPPELLPQCTTIEYAVRKPPGYPPLFMFVIDTCIPKEELQALKDTIITGISFIPENAYVGLIVFGTMVQVVELGYAACSKVHVFRGDKDYTTAQVQELLGLIPAKQQKGQPAIAQGAFGRFLMPLSECEDTFTSFLEELRPDPWPVKTNERPLRGTGSAIAVAIGLLESAFPNSPARIMTFIGGPSTLGAGQVVDVDLKNVMRSHHEIQGGNNTQYIAKASKYYSGLAQRAVKNGHVVDLLVASLDQSGVLEMKELPGRTGGIVFNDESFGGVCFKKSYQKMFSLDEQGFLDMSFSGTIEILTNREIRVAGAIGNLSSLAKKSNSVAESVRDGDDGDDDHE